MFILFIYFQSSIYASVLENNKKNIQFLNKTEQQWLQNLRLPLKVGITQIPNQILKTKNGYRGYSIDLFNKLSSLLNTQFSFVYYNSWPDLLQAAKDKKVDVVFLAQKTAERLHYFNFTDTVLVQKNKILSSVKRDSHTDLEELFGEKVAVVKDSAIEEFIKLNYPQIILIDSKSEIDTLEKLLGGKVSYTIVEPVRASYYMKQNNIDNLYITGDFPYDYKLRIAIRNDKPMLSIILNKALDQITPSEKKALALKWGYEKEVFFDKKLLTNIAILFFITFLFLFYLSVLNRKLHTTQKQLSKINETLEQRIKEEVEKNRQKDLALINQSRYAQMGQIINMIAHQWRQPLNAISLLTQASVIKCKKKALTDEELDEFKRKTLLQVQYMSKTIDDFRDFFKQQKEKSNFNLNEIIMALVDIIEPILEKSNIKLRVTYKDSNIIVYGFSNELSQAILNILYNAKDALIENNKNKERNIHISLAIQNRQAIIKIEDNAGGIDPDVLQNIFEPYFSTKGKLGTGLGLYMSKIIIEQHMDGQLLAYNKNSGAVFEIKLPLI